MLACKKLEDKMCDVEKCPWVAFRHVVHGSLGNNMSDNYKELVDSLIVQCTLCGDEMQNVPLHAFTSELFLDKILGM